jgi:cation transport ATPase
MTAFRSGRSVAAMTTTLHRIQDERLAAVLALLITIGALAFANFGGSGDNGGLVPFAVCAGVCAILAAVLFGRVLPGAADPARAAWILAALALATCVVFWSGLPFVLGMGAVYSGGRAGGSAPVALGALAMVLAFAACVIG